MTTHRLILTAIALGSLSLEATAHAQFRGRPGGFSGPQNGGNRFVQQQFNPQRNFIQTPNQGGPKSSPINLNNGQFRSLVPNQAGNNAPKAFNLAPTQAGNNAPRAFAPTQAGNNAPRAFNLAPTQAGNNAPSANFASSGFASFNQGFGGGSSNGFGGASQQFASATPTSTSFSPQSFAQQPAQQSFTQQAFTQNSFAASPSTASASVNSFASTPSQTVTAQRPPVLPQQQFGNGPIRIVLPKAYSLGVNYTLNQFTYAMKPGERQGFREDREWVVRFDRGLSLGTFEYTLTPGTYCFVCDSATGWQLYQISDQTAVALVQ